MEVKYHEGGYVGEETAPKKRKVCLRFDFHRSEANPPPSLYINACSGRENINKQLFPIREEILRVEVLLVLERLTDCDVDK